MLKTDDVLTAIRAYSSSLEDGEGRVVFTTRDIADAMGAEEYPVRVAFSWLRRFRVIEAVEGTAVFRHTRRAGEKYAVSMYRLRADSSPADFDALYRACGLAGARR